MIGLLLRKWRELTPGVFFRRAGFYAFFYAFNFVFLIFKQKRLVYCHPEAPTRAYIAWKFLKLNGLEVTRDAAKADLFLRHYGYAGETDWSGCPVPAGRFINGRCSDVGKDNVQKVFREIFDIDLKVDPCNASGPIVCKAIENAAHDGRVLEAPLAEDEIDESRFVYERLIDNRLDDDRVVDHRVFIVGDEIAYVWLKIRSLSDRFSNDNDEVITTSVEAEFSPDEVEKIRAFSRYMNFELGGLDILRDRRDGQIYVVDVNPSSAGPPVLHEGIRGIRAALVINRYFRRWFLDGGRISATLQRGL